MPGSCWSSPPSPPLASALSAAAPGCKELAVFIGPEGDFTAEKNKATVIAQIPVYYSEKKILIFEWEANGERGWNHYLCGMPPFSLNEYKEVIEKYHL